MFKLSVVTLDLWQTLILEDGVTGQKRESLRICQISKILGEFGQNFTIDQIQRSYLEGLAVCEKLRKKERDVSFKKQVSIFVRSLDRTLYERLDKSTISSIERAYDDCFWEFPTLIHKDAERVLFDLKKRGFKLGLVSNTGPTSGGLIRRFLETKRLACFFDAMTFSDEAGFAKPAREMFINTLTQLGSNSKEAVHIGDDLNTDIFGGNRAGLKTIWVKGFVPPLSDKEIRRFPSPDAVISNLSQVPQAVEELYKRSH